MKRLGWMYLLLAALLIPAAADELHYDSGTVDGGAMGEGYWGVRFDETLTGGSAGTITWLGALIYPDWPDSSYQGSYLYIFEDLNGLPGSSLMSCWLLPTSPGTMEWRDIDDLSTDSVFWVAWRPYGNPPACDALGYDDDGGTGHSYGPDGWITDYDLMLRCEWTADQPVPVEEGSWGEIKALW